MSKFNINVKSELFPFREALAQYFDKVVNDTKAFIGREEAANGGNNVKSKLSGVTITANCILESKEGYKLALPLNNPLSILLRFGMQLTKIDMTMGTRVIDKELNPVDGLSCDILPENCRDWFNQTIIGKTAVTPSPVPVAIVGK